MTDLNFVKLKKTRFFWHLKVGSNLNDSTVSTGETTQFHYPLDPKKIRAEGSIHKDTTYQGSDRQDFYRHGKKKKKKKKENK